MTDKLTASEVLERLKQLSSDWLYNDSESRIERAFKFRNYHECMAFSNAVAWIAHQKDHHPDMLITYNTCIVVFTTHSAKGITALDINCAREVDWLLPNV